MRERRAGVSPAEAARRGRLAGRRLDALLLLLGARRVGVYAAVRGELDLSALWGAGGDSGREYYFPRVEGDGLRFCPAARPERALRPGAFGIPEPPPEAPALDAGELDVAVTPGLAFDARGGRLGSGGGFYDRAFRRPPGEAGGPLLVGAGYAFQLLVGETLPRDAWDVGVDWVITDREALRCLPRAYMP